MILYVNGDSHAAAAEAATQFWFCIDDPRVSYLGNLPHPENLEVSWGKLLSLAIKAGYHCDAHADTNNIDVITETRKWIQDNQYQNKLIIIQWGSFTNQQQEQEEIWNLHQELIVQNIPHVFLNSTQAFTNVPKYNWGINYIGPYDAELTYSSIIRSKGINLAPNALHFGIDGHSFFNRFMLQYIIVNKLI
jgi:hypothetical protein